MAVAELRLSYAQFSVTAAAAGVKPGRIPPLTEFLPDTPSEKPDEPLTFRDWARVLLPLAGRRI